MTKPLLAILLAPFISAVVGCQTAENIRPIETGPYHVKFSYNEWYGGDQWPGMDRYARAYCSSLGKSIASRYPENPHPWFTLKLVDNSWNKHVSYPCFTPDEMSWVAQICSKDDGSDCGRIPEIFLAARGVDVRTQIGKLTGAAAVMAASLPPASGSQSQQRAPAGFSVCTYRAGSFVWTDTTRGMCPISSSKGGLIGSLQK